MVFSDIENAVLTGEVDAGLIIHENRFTYEEKGLKKIEINAVKQKILGYCVNFLLKK